MRRKPPLRDRSMREYLQFEGRFQAIAARHQTDEGLIPCDCLHLRTDAEGYELTFIDEPSVAVFPLPAADLVANALVDRPALWRQAALRVTYHPSIWGSAPVFGVPFRRAVEIATKAGHIKSKYFLPDTQRHGQCESLLLHLRSVDDIRGRLLQLEAWQYLPGQDCAHYLHAMSADFLMNVVHLDGATIRYADLDLDTLLLNTKKVKGTDYTKYFRLDGIVGLDDMHALAVAFLPGEQLYNEALNVDVLPKDA